MLLYAKLWLRSTFAYFLLSLQQFSAYLIQTGLRKSTFPSLCLTFGSECNSWFQFFIIIIKFTLFFNYLNIIFSLFHKLRITNTSKSLIHFLYSKFLSSTMLLDLQTILIYFKQIRICLYRIYVNNWIINNWIITVIDNKSKFNISVSKRKVNALSQSWN